MKIILKYLLKCKILYLHFCSKEQLPGIYIFDFVVFLFYMIKLMVFRYTAYLIVYCLYSIMDHLTLKQYQYEVTHYSYNLFQVVLRHNLLF